MKNFFNRLANKLIFAFTLTISIFIIALIYVSYNRTSDILVNDFIGSNKSILRLVNKNYENYVAQIDELTVNFRKDPQFMKYLTNGYWDDIGELYIQNQIKILFYSRDDIEKLQFFIPGSGKTYSISRSNDKLGITYSRSMTHANWYQKTINGDFFRYIEPLVNVNPSLNNKNSLFTFHRVLVSIPGWKPLGVISLSFNRFGLDKMFNDTFNRKEEELCIYDKDNQPFYFSDPERMNDKTVRNLMKDLRSNDNKKASGHFRVMINNQQYLIVFDDSEQNEWSMVKLIPVKLINDKVRQTRNISFVIGGIFIILFIALVIMVSNTITSPLRRLTRQMDKVSAGNFNVKATMTGSYEIVRLSERFNFMVDQINQLIREKYLAQINEKTAQLKALEAQINPHFLYNSLQAIATKAVIGGMKEISQMIEALAYILRYCIKGGDRVRISEEIQHIQKYLMLQSIRYEERLSVEIEVEQGLSDILIPKLSIQTLVENAVQHALEHMTRAITIGINTYTQDNRIVIKVSDNGPGMKPDHLQAVIREMNQGIWQDNPNESIGLKNLNTRLKLMYGDEAELQIHSIESQGTEVKIIFPRIPGGNAHVSSIDN